MGALECILEKQFYVVLGCLRGRTLQMGRSVLNYAPVRC